MLMRIGIGKAYKIESNSNRKRWFAAGTKKSSPLLLTFTSSSSSSSSFSCISTSCRDSPVIWCISMEAVADVVTTSWGKKKKRAREIRKAGIAKKQLKEQECSSTSASSVGDIEDLNMGEILKIRASLLDWYDTNKRDLPWRTISPTSTTAATEDSDSEEENDRRRNRAYAVWVSEIMLQQTRVQTVIHYFNRWMLKWPSLLHLSQASLEEVNEMWAGLGYYRRARFLLEGAKMIVEQGGAFPNTLSALRQVPGIGDYTAGAIASIAFKEVVPVVDGNVVRVIARLKTISANPKNSTTVKHIWKLAGQLVDPRRPGDFNQALMELGATLCTPLNPSCSTCPISSQCHALSVSRRDSSVHVTDFPTKVVKANQRQEFSAVSVVEIIADEALVEEPQSYSRFLLVKRPDEGLLAGLWEFPSVPLTKEVDLITRRNASDHFLKSSFGLDPKNTCNVVLRYDIGEYVHIFSHIRLKMYVEFLVLHLKGGKNLLHEKLDKETMCWKCVKSKDIESMGLTSGVRKVYTMIQRFKQHGFKSVPPKARKVRVAKGSKKLSNMKSEK